MKIKATLMTFIIIISSLSFFSNVIINDNFVSGGFLYVGTGSTYNSIQAAIDNATSGDVIYIANGTYNGSITVHIPDLKIIGNSSTECRLIHNYSGTDTFDDYAGVVNISANNVTLSGFNISAYGSYTYGIYLNSSTMDSNIENNIIFASGPGCGGIVITDSINNNLNKNSIYTNGTGGDGIILNSTSRLFLEDSVVRTRASGAHGIKVINSSYVWVDNVTVETVNGSSSALVISNSKVQLFNSSIDSSAGIDCILQYDANATFINVSFDTLNVTRNQGGILWVYNYLYIIVLSNETKTPLVGADVLVIESGNQLYNSTGFGGADLATDSTGRIPALSVVDRWYPKSNIPIANQTLVTVKKTINRTWEEQRDVDMASSHTEIFITSDITAPSSPTGLNVTPVPGQDIINLSWDQNTDDTVAYSIYTNRSGNWLLVKNISHPLTIANDTYLFVHNRDYYYRISAWDEVPIESPLSAPVSIRFYDEMPPDTPAGLSVNSIIKGDAINITWFPNSGDTKKYSVYSNRSGSWEILANVTHPVTNYIDNRDLLHGVRYYYRVSAWDEVPLQSNLSAPASTVHEDQEKPAPPRGLNATGATGTTIELIWQPNNETDLAGYMIFINATSAGSGGPYINLTVVNASTTKYIVKNLKEQVTYYFVINAFDEVPLFSDYSNEAGNTTRDSTPPLPPKLAVLPEFTNDTELVVHGETEPNATIRAIVNGAESAEGIADFKGEFNLVVNLVEGTNTISVYAIDRATNAGEPTPQQIVILDTVPPVAFAGRDILEGKGFPVELNATGSYDEHSGIANYTWKFNFDNISFRLYGLVVYYTFNSVGNYTVILRVTDYAGNWFEDDVVVRIIEGPVDRTPPRIRNQYPAAGSTNIPVKLVIEMKFNEPIYIDSFKLNLSAPVNLTSAGQNSRTITYDNVPGVVVYDEENETVRFTPVRTLMYNLTYYVNLSVADLFENTLALIWNFTTQQKPTAPPDTIPPSVNLTQFVRRNKRLGINEQIHIPFTEAMNETSITISVHDSKGNYVNGDWVYVEDTFTVVFTPNSTLKPNELYTIYLNGEDLAGNPLTPETRTLTFTTEKEDTELISPFLIWLMLAVILVVILLIIVILAFRRRQKKEMGGEEEFGEMAEEEISVADEDEEEFLDEEDQGSGEEERMFTRYAEDEVECPNCGSYLTEEDDYCFTCGWDPKIDGVPDKDAEEE